MKGFDKANSKKTNGKMVVPFSMIVGTGLTTVLYYLVSPLHIFTRTNEPVSSNAFSRSCQEFEEMTEGQRINA
jgi:hypothetical protein